LELIILEILNSGLSSTMMAGGGAEHDWGLGFGRRVLTLRCGTLDVQLGDCQGVIG